MNKHFGKTLAALLVMTLLIGMTSAASASIEFFKDTKGATYADFYYSNDDLMFSPELKNAGDKTVNYIELAVFCTDADFNPIYPDDGEDDFIRYFDSAKGYASGRIAPFGSCRMEGCKGASYVFCAVVKYSFRDGETVDLSDPSKTDILEKYAWSGWAF